MSRARRKLETIETLAERFALPRRTLVREVMSARLPYVSIGGSWRFRERDVQTWLARAGSLPRLSVIQGGIGRRRGSATDDVSVAGDARV